MYEMLMRMYDGKYTQFSTNEDLTKINALCRAMYWTGVAGGRIGENVVLGTDYDRCVYAMVYPEEEGARPYYLYFVREIRVESEMSRKLMEYTINECLDGEEAEWARETFLH